MRVVEVLGGALLACVAGLYVVSLYFKGRR